MKSWETPDMITLDVDQTAESGPISANTDLYVYSNADRTTYIMYHPSGIEGQAPQQKTNLTIDQWKKENGY